MTRVVFMALLLAGCANTSINQSCIFLCQANCNTTHQEKPK